MSCQPSVSKDPRGTAYYYTIYYCRCHAPLTCVFARSTSAHVNRSRGCKCKYIKCFSSQVSQPSILFDCLAQDLSSSFVLRITATLPSHSLLRVLLYKNNTPPQGSLALEVIPKVRLGWDKAPKLLLSVTRRVEYEATVSHCN